jgi:hypothetical protein
MRAWLFMLGGLVIWASHFLGVYLIASVADLVDEADAAAARRTVGGFTLLCAAAAAAIGLGAWRRSRDDSDPVSRFTDWLAAASGAFAMIAVLWQGLPALVGH